MSGMRRVSLLGLMGGLMLCFNAPARAQDDSAGADQLREELKQVREELKQLRKEVAAGFKGVNKTLADIKKGQGSAARPKKKADTKVYDIKIGDSPFLGPKDAAVTIVEFSDFQCPFCIREYPKIKQILKQYPDDVRLVFKHFPLGFHKKAPGASAATVLAHQELGNEGFWKMHDMITAAPKKLEVSNFRGYAEQLGMDLAKFDKVMGDPVAINALIKDDIAEAKRVGVRGTPTIMVNGLKMAKRNPADYKKRVEEILAKAKKPKLIVK